MKAKRMLIKFDEQIKIDDVDFTKEHHKKVPNPKKSKINILQQKQDHVERINQRLLSNYKKSKLKLKKYSFQQRADYLR